MQNDLLEKVARELLAAVNLVKEELEQPETKTYIFFSVEFFFEEIIELPLLFRELFEDCGCCVRCRKYRLDNNKNVYELRFFRDGYNIVCRSDNLTNAKRKFIEQANKLFQ